MMANLDYLLDHVWNQPEPKLLGILVKEVLNQII